MRTAYNPSEVFNLGDGPTEAECAAMGVERVFNSELSKPQPHPKVFLKGTKRVYLKAVKTAEFRKPMRGDRYLSGSSPAAYLALHDLDHECQIMRLVAVQERTQVTWKVVR